MGRACDVVAGVTFNQPEILRAVFGKADGLPSLCLQNLAVSAFGLPGVLLAIAALRPLGTKPLQAWGFGLIALCACAFALSNRLAPTSVGLNFALTCALITSLNWGPNVSTYVLPAAVFPPEVRASLFGVSAAMGKLGALLGGVAFGPIAAAGPHGMSIVFLLCAALAGAGVAVTALFVEPFGRDTFCRGPRHHL